MSHAGHSMSGGSMSSGSMDMREGAGGGNGIPTNDYLQQMYWAAVGAIIGAFTLVNLYTKYLRWQRLRSSSSTPAKPRAIPAVVMASTTAVFREVSNAPVLFYQAASRFFGQVPTVGKVSLVLSNLVVILVLSFYGYNTRDKWDWQDIGYRTGHITVAQLPLIFLLAGKRNILAALAGTSYERINWLHRWVSRVLFVSATIHMGFWFSDWNRYRYISRKVKSDPITQRGLAAWGVLAWIVFSSMTPIRGWAYEVFVVQHIVSFTALIALIYLHIPEQHRVFVWICVGYFFFDRLLRGGYYLYNNLFKFHAQPNASGSHRDLWGSRAQFTALPGGCTKVTLTEPPCKWKAGQHVFLSCHALAPLQAHPFTISSIPSDGFMEFIIQSRSGGTKRFMSHAERSLPQTQDETESWRHVAIEGPYGRVRPLEQFDSVVLFAGSTGSTFTTPLLRDIVHRWTTGGRVVTRHIKFVWVVKSGNQLDWFKHQLSRAVEDVKQLRSLGHDVTISISLYVTCDDAFTTKHKSTVAAFRGNLHTDDKDQIAPCAEPVNERAGKNEKSLVETVEEQPRGHKNCCCRGDVDEKDTAAPLCTCSCCGIEATSSDDSSSFEDIKKPSKDVPLLHPEINLYSGRPMIKDIIRTSLEQAMGEGAVLACGPQGLINDVRNMTVQLSDERAVHKGTGAQGIYLHTEAFGY
ncbi:Ferric/cupric reductase transmembrane component 1 [Sphaceloma murrayae]|uniref:ferric-chelate reductase (NADPH) n=1 Tax=Sphaceloma murrayae TaxID=2082308 RepID=A0A2K1QJ47_9PEZI|nr:Ferric/cupric reductase transmembrane component 1 [Sphaceloma murrayae]